MSADARPTTPSGSHVPGAPTRPRKVGFAAPHDLTCPHGHRVREDAFLLEHGALRCKHKEPRRQSPDQRRRGEPAGHEPECGAWLYVLACAGWALPQADGDDGKGARPTMFFVAEVTFAELREMQARRLDVAGVLNFLGVRFGAR